ncbi:phosphomannomutase/phosphoglucomutase [bacterium]|nr:MAG: phosphomannomutase/phosphoglucomutase [bacterium]
MQTQFDPSIFKSYDVRGIYPTQLSADFAYQLGRGFAAFLQGKSPAKATLTVGLGRDMRTSGPVLAEAFSRGLVEQGVDVVDVGQVSTDAIYFAVGKYELDGGAMITASHNPKDYNGFKLCRGEAMALSSKEGLDEIRAMIERGTFSASARRGTVTQRDILDDFARHCLSFVDVAKIKPFKIAIDCGNGMGGKTVPYVFKHLPCTVIPLYFELDGTFPHHQPSPIEPENMVDVQRAVREHHCDLGVAFDGDADRMFLVDERGELVGGGTVTALVAENELRKHPGAKILYNLICSRSVPEWIERHGGRPLRSQVGHSLIKATMRKEDAVFGGEHSGHFYFRDNWYADSGMIALLECLEVFSKANAPVSHVAAPLQNRSRSGELNSTVADIPAKIAQIEHAYADGKIDHLDGVTVQYDTWWFNVRPSNTEPLLRLNLEADDRATMERRRDEVLALIRS